MTDFTMNVDALIRETLARDGPERAPAALAPAVMARTESIAQRRPWVRALDREAWPPLPGTVADPTMRRMLLVGVAMMLAVVIVATATFVGVRLFQGPYPRLAYYGEFAKVTSLSTSYAGPTVVPLDDRRVFLTGHPASAGAILGEVVDVATGRTVMVSAPQSSIVVEQAVGLDDGRVAVLASVQDGDAVVGRSLILIVDADGTSAELPATIQPRYGAAIAVLPDRRLLIAGGTSAPESPDVLLPDIVDLESATIRSTGPLRQPRSDAALTRLADGQVVVSGGHVFESPEPGQLSVRHVLEIEVYDPDSGTFRLAGSLPDVAANMPPVRLLDDSLLILGPRYLRQCNQHASIGMETYRVDPRAGTVETGVRVPHDVVAATRLDNGTVLMAGPWTPRGSASGGCTVLGGTEGILAESWIGTYDPVTGENRFIYDPMIGDASRPGEPLAPVGGAATMPDGRVVLVTWDEATGADPSTRANVVIYE